MTTLNEQILLAGEAEPTTCRRPVTRPRDEADDRGGARAVPVPALSGLAIALCTGVTVLFGVWPQPLIDFANHATLLFLPK